MSWIDYLSNARSYTVKKTLFEVLQSRYSQNEKIIERLSVTLATENDLKDFMKFVADIYEVAYMKCVEDHRQQLEKAGIVAKIVPHSKDG